MSSFLIGFDNFFEAPYKTTNTEHKYGYIINAYCSKSLSSKYGRACFLPADQKEFKYRKVIINDLQKFIGQPTWRAVDVTESWSRSQASRLVFTGKVTKTVGDEPFL